MRIELKKDMLYYSFGLDVGYSDCRDSFIIGFKLLKYALIISFK